MDDCLTYSLEARIRVALSASAARVSTAATSLVPTYGEYGCPPGELVADAASAAKHADEALTYAIACERRRGTTWERIADTLGEDVATVRGRHEEPVERLQRRLLEAWLDPDADHHLPEGADDPGGHAARLDDWLAGAAGDDEDFRHHPDAEVRDHPVSAGLAVMSVTEHRDLLGTAGRLVAGRDGAAADAPDGLGDDQYGDLDAERGRRAAIGLYQRRIALLEWLLAEEVNDPAVTGLSENALRTLLGAARRRLARL